MKKDLLREEILYQISFPYWQKGSQELTSWKMPIGNKSRFFYWNYQNLIWITRHRIYEIMKLLSEMFESKDKSLTLNIWISYELRYIVFLISLGKNSTKDLLVYIQKGNWLIGINSLYQRYRQSTPNLVIVDIIFKIINMKEK